MVCKSIADNAILEAGGTHEALYYRLTVPSNVTSDRPVPRCGGSARTSLKTRSA